jgi:ABC-type ATPase with predicted acetyltransferase domain
VPAWLRPYPVLSNGERFRAGLARLVCEQPGEAVVDEFTSVVDRQIARLGALAFAKAWRCTAGEKGGAADPSP